MSAETAEQCYIVYIRKFMFDMPLKKMRLNTSKGFALCMKKTGNHRELKETPHQKPFRRNTRQALIKVNKMLLF